MFLLGFDVLTAAIMKSSIVWDITLCLLPALLWYLLWLIIRSWRWRQYIPRNRRLIFSWLHGPIFQKTEQFKLMHLIDGKSFLPGRRAYRRTRKIFGSSAFHFDSCEVKNCNPFNWVFPLVICVTFVTILPITHCPINWPTGQPVLY
jgi:uncharacterized membrane protein YjgN (DUF898 family)